MPDYYLTTYLEITGEIYNGVQDEKIKDNIQLESVGKYFPDNIYDSDDSDNTADLKMQEYKDRIYYKKELVKNNEWLSKTLENKYKKEILDYYNKFSINYQIQERDLNLKSVYKIKT